jgi:hypothetical protein
MRRTLSILALISASAVTACTPLRTPDLGRADVGATCSVVTAHATSIGEATSRRYAETSLNNELRDLKGDYVSAQFRGVRVAGRGVVCQPYALTGGSGVYHCQAAARVCGR